MTSFIKSINLGPRRKEKKFTKTDLFIKRLAQSASNKLPYSLPIIGKLEFIQDVADFGIKKALYYLCWRFWGLVTFSELRSKLNNGWDYFKVGFKTRDFDSAFALEEFNWKLGRIRKHLSTCQVSGDWKRDSQNIRKVEYLLGRVLNDNYSEEELNKLNEKYGERIYDFDECFKVRRAKETDANHEDIKILERSAYDMAFKKRQKEWKKALELIQNHFFEWWD